MAEKNSSPDYRENKRTICAEYNRLLAYLSRQQRERLPESMKHRIGISADFEPHEITFVGKLKPVKWQKLDVLFQTDIRTRVAETCPIEQLVDDCKIWTGEEVRNMFCERLRPGSCMNKSFCEEWLDIYCDNPNDVDGISYSSQLTQGKSCSWLRWKGNRTNTFGKLYANCDAALIGVIRDRVSFRLGVKPHCPKPKTFVLRWSGERLPYMDEYRYCKDYSEDDGTMTLSRDSDNDNHGDAREYETGWHPTEEAERRQCCESCGCTVDEEEAYYIHDTTYCCDCCGYCEWSEESLPSDEISHYTVYANGRNQEMHIGENARDNDFTRSDYTRDGDVELIEDCEVVNLGNGNDCSPDFDGLVYDVDGEPQHVNDCEECQTNNEWYTDGDDRIVRCKTDDEWYLKTDDDIVEIDDEWYLKTDDDIVEIDDDIFAIAVCV